MDKHKTHDEKQPARPAQPARRQDGKEQDHPTGDRGKNEGIGTENDPSGTAPADPRKEHGRNEGVGTKNIPSGPPAPAKTHPDDFARSEPPQAPASTGPTVADADAPVLQGHEGDKYETVYLTAGPDKGTPFRVATPLPQVVVAGGQRYLRSTHDTYVWQVP